MREKLLITEVSTLLSPLSVAVIRQISGIPLIILQLFIILLGVFLAFFGEPFHEAIVTVAAFIPGTLFGAIFVAPLFTSLGSGSDQLMTIGIGIAVGALTVFG
ncbi:MAG: hypothetical protein ABEI06_06700, partial [Halobacteriaceae archaeon]